MGFEADLVSISFFLGLGFILMQIAVYFQCYVNIKSYFIKYNYNNITDILLVIIGYHH